MVISSHTSCMWYALNYELEKGRCVPRPVANFYSNDLKPHPWVGLITGKYYKLTKFIRKLCQGHTQLTAANFTTEDIIKQNRLEK